MFYYSNHIAGETSLLASLLSSQSDTLRRHWPIFRLLISEWKVKKATATTEEAFPGLVSGRGWMQFGSNHTFVRARSTKLRGEWWMRASWSLRRGWWWCEEPGAFRHIMQVTFPMGQRRHCWSLSLPPTTIFSSARINFAYKSHSVKARAEGGEWQTFFSRSRIKSLWWAGKKLSNLGEKKFNLKLTERRMPSLNWNHGATFSPETEGRKLLMMSMKPKMMMLSSPRLEEGKKAEPQYWHNFFPSESYFALLCSSHDNKFIRHLRRAEEWSDFERLAGEVGGLCRAEAWRRFWNISEEINVSCQQF